jgi:hypothetical protein
MSWDMELDEKKLEDLYEWIDQVPLTRPKKRIERDFSDGCMIAELVRHFLPNLVDLHNFTPANNLEQKMANWGTLNTKVFSKFGLNVPENITHNICTCKPGYVEVLLHNLRYKITEQIAKIEKPKFYINPGTKTPRTNTVMGTNRVIKSHSGGSHNASQYIPRIDYEEKVQECLEQAEALEVLQAKIRRLEHLLQLKDIRIQELSDKLDKYRPTASVPANRQVNFD